MGMRQENREHKRYCLWAKRSTNKNGIFIESATRELQPYPFHHDDWNRFDVVDWVGDEPMLGQYVAWINRAAGVVCGVEAKGGEWNWWVVVEIPQYGYFPSCELSRRLAKTVQDSALNLSIEWLVNSVNKLAFWRNWA